MSSSLRCKAFKCFSLSLPANTFFFTALMSSSIVFIIFPYLKLLLIGVLHFGQTFTLIVSSFVSPFIHLSKPFTSKIWLQSTSWTNRASSSSSKPKKISLIFCWSHFLHQVGHGSPHSPIHLSKSLQDWHVVNLGHGRLHGLMLHCSWQLFCWHFWCLQPKLHGIIHGMHIAPHFSGHWLCMHWFRHSSWHGGHALEQGSLQTCEHTRTRLHGCVHFICRRPWWHSEQFPLQLWPHSSFTEHFALQIASTSGDLEQSSSSWWPHRSSLVTLAWQIISDGSIAHGAVWMWPHEWILLLDGSLQGGQSRPWWHLSGHLWIAHGRVWKTELKYDSRVIILRVAS